MEEDLLADDELTEATRKVVQVVTREHPLSGNQLFHLASQLHRIATHRIAEEHIRQFRQRSVE